MQPRSQLPTRSWIWRVAPTIVLLAGMAMALAATAAYVYVPAVWWNGLRIERGMTATEVFEIMSGRWTRIVT